MYLDRLAALIGRRPWLIVAIVLLLTVPVAMYARGLEFRDSFGELLEKGHASVQNLDAVSERIGGTAFLVVAIGAEDLPRAKRFADALDPILTDLETVLYVEGRVDVQFLEERQLLYLTVDELEELVDDIAGKIDVRFAESTGLFVDLSEPGDDEKLTMPTAEIPIDEYKIGKDGRYLYQFVRLAGHSGDLSFGKRSLDEVTAATEALRTSPAFGEDLEVRYSGSVQIRAEENETMQVDLQRSSVLGFVGVVFMLALYTRRPRTLIIVSLPLLVGATWTFAFARATIGHLNIITGFLAPMLFGLGIDFAIHLFLRHVESRNRGDDALAATHVALSSTGRAVISGAITTAAAFFVVRFADFRGYTEFGGLAAMGIMVMLVVSLVFFPALNLGLERLSPIKPRKTSVGWFPPAAVRYAILIGVPLFAGFSIYRLATGGVVIHTNWRELKGESPASDFDDYIIDSLGTSNTTTLVYVDDPKDVRAATDAIRGVMEKRKAEKIESGVAKLISLADLVPPNQEDRLEYVQDLRKQLRRVKPELLSDDERTSWERALQLTDVEPFSLDDVPPSLRKRIDTPNGKGALIVLQTPYLFYEVDQLIAWAIEMTEIRDALDATGVGAHIMSENWVAGTVFAIIVNDGPFIIWAAFLGVFLVLLVDFRSLKHAVMVLSSLVVGVTCIAGAMALTGVQLNFINAVVVPSIVGIGIDGAIHSYHRFLDEGPDSIPIVLRHTSPATLLAATTTMVGFGAMIIARHAGIRSVGELAILGISTTYICTSVFFPLALHSIGKRLVSK